MIKNLKENCKKNVISFFSSIMYDTLVFVISFYSCEFALNIYTIMTGFTDTKKRVFTSTSYSSSKVQYTAYNSYYICIVNTYFTHRKTFDFSTSKPVKHFLQ